jgi:aconitate hydratase
MPSHAGLLPFRSNVPRLSKDCFINVDSQFSKRAELMGRSAIVGGHTYGQGSSREHAALVPLYLGVRVVIAKSFARIHRSNLINAGILPLTFTDESDYDQLQLASELSFSNLYKGLETGSVTVVAQIGTSGHLKRELQLTFEGTFREIEILKAGGALKHALA